MASPPGYPIYMPGETHQQRNCGRKTIFLNEDEAKRQAKKLHKLRKIKYSAYECGYCGAWHVGAERSKEAGKRRFDRLNHLE